MSPELIAHAKYKNGFLIVPSSIAKEKTIIVPEWWTSTTQDGLKIYYERTNKMAVAGNQDCWCMLICNYVMDLTDYHMDAQKVALRLANALRLSRNAFYDCLDDLNGRFVCLFKKDNNISLLNDATGQKPFYYHAEWPVAASHYNLLQDSFPSEEDDFWADFCSWVATKRAQKKGFPWVMPADRTPFAKIKCVLANHELELMTGAVNRFFPREQADAIDTTAAAELIADCLTRQMNCLVNNYNVFQGLTAGNDSRLSLAAGREVKDKVTYFTYYNLDTAGYDADDRQQNLAFARKIAQKEGLILKEILFEAKPVDKEVERVLKINHYHSHIPQILEPYSNLFEKNSIHLRSNIIELMRGTPHVPNIIPTIETIGQEFARKNTYAQDYPKFAKVADIFQRFYLDYQYNKILDYPLFSLFYWEYRDCKWLSGAVLTESDIVCETYQLLNCRKILKAALSVPFIYRQTRSMLYEQVMKILWSDLLDYSIPNKKETPYDLLNKWDFGLYTNMLFETESLQGNFSNKTTLPPPATIVETFSQGWALGFSSNNVHKDDWCGIKIKTSLSADVNYFCAFCIKVPFVAEAKGWGLYYEVLVDGKIVYSLPTNACFFSNHLRISLRPNKTGPIEILVRIKADRNLKNHNGVIVISNFELKRDFAFDCPHLTVVDSFYTIKTISAQKK